MLHILCIKLNQNFYFEKYLNLFDNKVQGKIKSYKFRKDQMKAFTSELLKYFYLAKILSKHPSDIVIKYNSYGKPFVINHDLEFNISHSDEFVVLAVSDNNLFNIGVDIEKYSDEINSDELSKIIFSDNEQKLTFNNPKNFFIIWTKKESFLKAHGTGFGVEYYKNTKLTLDSIEEFQNTIIYSKVLFSNYYFALCCKKVKTNNEIPSI